MRVERERRPGQVCITPLQTISFCNLRYQLPSYAGVVLEHLVPHLRHVSKVPAYIYDSLTPVYRQLTFFDGL
jgi:hypothetical protein